MTGTDLRSIYLQHQLKAVSRTRIQKGGETLLGRPIGSQQSLNITVNGVVYPVFVPGVDDPDDLTTTFYVP